MADGYDPNPEYRPLVVDVIGKRVTLASANAAPVMLTDVRMFCRTSHGRPHIIVEPKRESDLLMVEIVDGFEQIQAR